MTPLSVPRPWNEKRDMAGPPPSSTSPRSATSGVSQASSVSMEMAMSGASDVAAGRTPRRLCSSWTDQTRCSVGPGLP